MSSNYTEATSSDRLPRLPLKGSIDLTYRCNNNCRHCWLKSGDRKGELTTDEIKKLVDEARALGCREWGISGGEPMLRPDFPEIFDYITSKAKRYSLNTNGTLITREIAELMKRKGSKMVAVYGATAEVHDHVTRNPGSFDATMRGFSLLKEVGAEFTVQLIPMKDNYHQFEEMKALAQSLSPKWRIGAAWLYLSADAGSQKNVEINAQRLPPAEVVNLDLPNLSRINEEDLAHPKCRSGDDHLFDSCIKIRRDFHADPYGMLSFCCYLKDQEMRYDIRKGSLQDFWERFVPSLIGKVRGGEEYLKNCGSCEYRQDCRWCPVYGYLEHGRYSAPVEYLCEVAKEMRECKERMVKENRRYFRVADITIQVDSDIPFSNKPLQPKFEKFKADGPGKDTVTIRHHFELPDFPEEKRGILKYKKPPFAIYKNGNSWIYTTIPTERTISYTKRIAVFSDDYTSVSVYNDEKQT